MAVNSLDDYLDTLDENGDEYRKLSFILEQMRLARKNKYSRIYSPPLTIFSYIVFASSPAAYSFLLEQNVLCLASVNTVNKVTKRLNQNTGLDNSAYLSMRIEKLNEFQRNVLLIIDEIYIAKRVEYSGGTVQGLTPEGTVASTLLCFMISSLAGKYKDIVAILSLLYTDCGQAT